MSKPLNKITVDGKQYYEQPITHKPLSNICRCCAFHGTECYNRADFDCHGDSRSDGMDVFFVEVK